MYTVYDLGSCFATSIAGIYTNEICMRMFMLRTTIMANVYNSGWCGWVDINKSWLSSNKTTYDI